MQVIIAESGAPPGISQRWQDSQLDHRYASVPTVLHPCPARVRSVDTDGSFG